MPVILIAMFSRVSNPGRVSHVKQGSGDGVILRHIQNLDEKKQQQQMHQETLPRKGKPWHLLDPGGSSSARWSSLGPEGLALKKEQIATAT